MRKVAHCDNPTMDLLHTSRENYIKYSNYWLFLSSVRQQHTKNKQWMKSM